MFLEEREFLAGIGIGIGIAQASVAIIMESIRINDTVSIATMDNVILLIFAFFIVMLSIMYLIFSKHEI